MNSYHIHDKVKVVDEKGKLIKEGVITGLTTCGAQVFNPKCEKPFSDSPETAEWFPFDAPKRKMIVLQSKKKRKPKFV